MLGRLGVIGLGLGVDPAGVISTFAGGSVHGDDDMPAADVSLLTLTPIAIAPSGDIYVGERDAGRVRRIDSVGMIHTVAGNGMAPFSGDGGPATAVGIDDPQGLLRRGAAKGRWPRNRGDSSDDADAST